jgi:hypothetical protein
VKRLAFALLLLAAPAFADTPEPQAVAPSVKLPPTLTTKVGAWMLIPADVSGGVPQWYLPDGKKADKTRALHMREAVPGEGLAEVPLESIFGEDWARKAQGRVFTSNVPGVFRVCAYNARGDMASLIATCVVTVEGPAPPPGPAPPGPTPGPTPPGPAPPGPAPIPGDGFRVLMVYESADLTKLPPDQLNVLYSQKVRDYLNTHCAKGPDGKTPEWRIWDANVPTGAEAKAWQDAMNQKRDKLPWLIVSNGKTGFAGPLPPNTDATLRLLQQYGGQ